MPESEMMDSIDDRINADEEILQIIYFLSRKGRIEHPHLIRVHHSDLGGVRLKDVKRWLSDVRGKEMPNNFSWSYKRRYKTGYIWQDLQDNDVINPITDKEYVLKGSEKSATSSPDRKPKRSNSFPAKKKIDSILEKTMSELSDHRTLRAGYEPMEDTRCNDDKKLEHLSIAAITSTNDILNPFGIYGLADSFSDSSQTDDGSTICSSREASNRENDVEKKFVIEQEIKEEVDGAPKMEDTEEDEDERLIRKNKKGSRLKRKGGCSSMNSRAYSRFLKDLLSCRAVDTKESAVKPLQCQPSMQKPSVKSSTSLEISSVKNGEGRNMNGSACWKSQKHVEKKKTYDGNPSPASVCTFLPQPTCSQCGKRFNPERLDAHMRSCKGLKLKDKRSAKQHLPQGDTEAANLTREETGAWM